MLGEVEFENHPPSFRYHPLGVGGIKGVEVPNLAAALRLAAFLRVFDGSANIIFVSHLLDYISHSLCHSSPAMLHCPERSRPFSPTLAPLVADTKGDLSAYEMFRHFRCDLPATPGFGELGDSDSLRWDFIVRRAPMFEFALPKALFEFT